MFGCERWLTAAPPRTAAELLRTAADTLDPEAFPDRYGEGDVVEAFEARLAELLGHEAAALMPSGTMAQQIALRLHCEVRGRDTVAFHPTCHLELHEHGAYARLHGLKAELLGGRDRLLERSDLETVRVPLGALLLELPQREIGGRLPEWDDLLAQVGWAHERGAAVHLDGARIWEAAPYYERTPAELGGLFDSVYASLYKGLGAFAGCVLAGPAEFVAQARVWQRRHGGALFNLFPFAASAQPGVERAIARMPDYLEHARAVAGALSDVEGVRVVPDPPQTPLFHVHLRGDRPAMEARALELAQERRVWVLRRLEPSVVPGVCSTELHLGEAALEVSPAEAAELFGLIVEAGGR